MELLEYLSEELGCDFLSDLHYITPSPEQVQFILSIPPNQYLLQDYQEAVAYLSQDPGSCHSISQAKHLLIQKLLKL